MFISKMDTPNFEWYGAGETEEEAEKALKSEWRKWRKVNDNPSDMVTAEQIDEYFGIWTFELKAGEGKKV